MMKNIMFSFIAFSRNINYLLSKRPYLGTGYKYIEDPTGHGVRKPVLFYLVIKQHSYNIAI